MLVVVLLTTTCAGAAEWHVTPDGQAENQGTADSPWDLTSALSGSQDVQPGDTVWLAAGTYRWPEWNRGGLGLSVRLNGAEGSPIVVRAPPGARATIDGGIEMLTGCSYVWLRDLEVTVSEPHQTTEESGSHPESLKGPSGGVSVADAPGCKFIDLLIHDNTGSGMNLWKPALDAEVYGCIFYGNGWQGPDRHHGHSIYTQNAEGTKTIANCIMSTPGGGSYTMHAYGSSRANVDNFVVEHNVCHGAGPFLIGGGAPSHNITARGNVLHGIGMRIGYTAEHNEDCVVTDNTIVRGGLEIVKYRQAVTEDNVVWNEGDARPTEPWVYVKPHKYAEGRAHLAVVNWAGTGSVQVDVSEVLENGERYRLLDPSDFYGTPLAEGEVADGKIAVPVDGEFGVYVLMAD
ncbi:MAG TPA: right-handed parallel beta-helix repeat-containing protein [Armatimonadota bacterium]|nr:right-handed parallel beta-helix repeat-containing protein [Armatimonadota bacterium]